MYAGTFEQLEKQLREFVHFDSKDPPYDANGAFMLFTAIVDNLATHYQDHDFENLTETPPILSKSQEQLLRMLLHYHEIAGTDPVDDVD